MGHMRGVMKNWLTGVLLAVVGGAFVACDPGPEPSGSESRGGTSEELGATAQALAQACWPAGTTDAQKVCSDGWFFSMRCYKRQASAACGTGSDGNFASCRHSSHGEAPSPECQFDGIYTSAGQSLQAARQYAAARWQAASGVGAPEFTIEPTCTACSDLEGTPTDIVPTEVDVGTGKAAGRMSIHSEVTSDGAGTFSIPLWVPPGRLGMEPSISLEYHSRSGNGFLGKGWSLSGFSRISRCTRTIAQDGFAGDIKFDTTDRFCLDGSRLVAVNGPYGGHLTEYRTESNRFAKVVSLNPDGLGPTTFEVWLKDGNILSYGAGPGSRVEGKRVHVTPTGTSGTLVDDSQDVRQAWSVSGMRDRVGNTMQVSYDLLVGAAPEHAVEQLPSVISYTGSMAPGGPQPSRTIYFSYSDRSDPTADYVAGFKLGRRKLLSRVEMWGPSPGGNAKLRDYRLLYSTSGTTGASLLASLQECDGQGVCMEPATMGWTTNIGSDFTVFDTGITDVARESGDAAETLWNIDTLDLNGDGKDDILYREYVDPTDGPPQGRWWYRLSTGEGFGPRQLAGLAPSLAPTASRIGRPADLDMDGRVDLVKLTDSTVLYDVYRSNGAGFTREDQSAHEALTMWATGSTYPAFYLADLNGDGLVEGIRSIETSALGNVWGFRLNTQGQLGPYQDWPMVAFTAGQEDKAYAAAVDRSGRTAFLVKDPGTDPFRYTALMLGENNLPELFRTTLKRTTSG